MLDLDHFKDINTAHGHIIGEQSLKAVGRFLKENLREKEIPTVYGGDEIIILLPDTDNATALDVAKHYHKTVASTPINTNRGFMSITLSLGLVTVAEPQIEAGGIYRSG